MAKEAYCAHRFNAATQPLFDAVVAVITLFEQMHLAVTGRQVYYKVRDGLADIVARCRAVRASQKVYKWEQPGKALYMKVCEVIRDGRDCGLIDWDSVIDEGRNPDMPTFWDDPADYIVPEGFKLDVWRDQPTYVEVWTEKLSHVALMKQATAGLYVPIQMCRGYGSSTALHDAAGRLDKAVRRYLVRADDLGALTRERKLVIFYAGDHDATGMDIDRDIRERLKFYNAPPVTVRRVALNIQQARHHHLLPERLNMRDERAEAYKERFGTDTWELDALDPALLQRLVRKAVEHCINKAAWANTKADIEVGKAGLRLVQRHYDVALAAALKAEENEPPEPEEATTP